MILRVECRSGYKADECPVRFQLDGQDHTVEEVVDQWYSPDARYFKVRSHDGSLYVLRHLMSPQQDSWSLESFRRS